MKRSVLLFLLASPSLVSCVSEAKMSKEECRSNLQRVFQSDWAGDAAGRVKAIEAYSDQCGSTPEYAVVLANSLYVAQRFAEARQVAHEGSLVADKEIQDKLLRTEFLSNVALKDLDGAFEVSTRALREDPLDWNGHLLMAKYYNLSGAYGPAIASAHRAIDLGAGSRGTTVLITAKYNAGDYAGAVAGFESELRGNPNYITDVDAVLAATGSYIELNDKGRAMQLLQSHLTAVPDSKESVIVIRAASILGMRI